MLADGKDECIVDSQSFALRLRNIEVMALGMGRGMAGQELVRRIRSIVQYGQRERQRMRIISDAMHKATLACVDLEDTLALVGREDRFHGVALYATDPFCLRKSSLGDDVSGLEEVAIYVPGIGMGLDFSKAFDVGRDGELDVHELKIFETQEAGIVVVHV